MTLDSRSKPGPYPFWSLDGRFLTLEREDDGYKSDLCILSPDGQLFLINTPLREEASASMSLVFGWLADTP